MLDRFVRERVEGRVDVAHGGGDRGRVGRSLARALALAATLALAVPAAAGASGAAAVPASTCFSFGYACTLGGYDAVTMNDNWATKYYGPAALGTLGEPPHNCTLFAAWMLARHGIPDPGRTWGNAWQWGLTLAKDVTDTPSVGSIAWYGAGRLANASGHVAWVSKVDARAGLVFLVSDNYGGGLRGSTSSGWTSIAGPSGYIHLAAPARSRPDPDPATTTTVPATTTTTTTTVPPPAPARPPLA